MQETVGGQHNLGPYFITARNAVEEDVGISNDFFFRSQEESPHDNSDESY